MDSRSFKYHACIFYISSNMHRRELTLSAIQAEFIFLSKVEPLVKCNYHFYIFLLKYRVCRTSFSPLPVTFCVPYLVVSRIAHSPVLSHFQQFFLSPPSNISHFCELINIPIYPYQVSGWNVYINQQRRWRSSAFQPPW